MTSRLLILNYFWSSSISKASRTIRLSSPLSSRCLRSAIDSSSGQDRAINIDPEYISAIRVWKFSRIDSFLINDVLSVVLLALIFNCMLSLNRRNRLISFKYSGVNFPSALLFSMLNLISIPQSKSEMSVWYLPFRNIQ